MPLINGKAVTAVLLIALLLVILYCYVSQSYRVVLSFQEKSKATEDDT